MGYAMSDMEQFPAVMSVIQLARYLHVKPSTVRAKVRHNEIPHTRLGERMVVFLRQVIDLWLIDNTTGQGAQRVKKMAIELRRQGAPAGRPLTRTEEKMLAASRADLEAGRTTPLSDR